jgi:Fanconi anemia group D2 protein
MVNIYPACVQDVQSILPICSLFNLLQCCVKNANNGSLEEIDALLGCGICMFEQDKLSVGN